MVEFSNIKKRYDELKTERNKYVPRWREIAKYAGIKLFPQETVAEVEKKSDDLDKFTEDPTAAISIQQSADYLKGIMWGTGESIITIEPSEELLEKTDISNVKDWYSYLTKKTLQEMNHSNAGLNSAQSAYFYGQMSYGTSGIGAFPNSSYKDGFDTNILLFRPYGVDTLFIDEGKNGLIEVVCNTYVWRTNRFVAEFCERHNGFDEKTFNNLPEKVRKAYEAGDFNQTFNVVQAVLPRRDYEPKALGKNGCKYIGCWFLDDAGESFFEEDYKEKPISVCRAEKINGEIYGRSSGTSLLSTIRCVNEMVSSSMVTLEKYKDPPLGTFSSALFGDDVIDTSPQGITVFNSALLAGKDPIFQIHDIGDPTPIISFLLPYFNEKIATAFKVDLLLDFSSSANMTATESLQRFAIRGRSLAGLIMQQKTELFEPLIKRCISILFDAGALGVNPDEKEKIEELKKRGATERIIPPEVIELIKEGKSWYKIKFNNEVEKLTKTEKVEDLLKMLNVITAIMSVNPDMALAIDWYKLLADVAEALGAMGFILSKQNFEKQIAGKAQQQAQLLQSQLAQNQSLTNKNNASALKEAS